jgi:L-aspartate oxidase
MPHQFYSLEGWELQNLLITAACMTDAALARNESRGVHFRSDFPQPDDESWRRHLTIQIDVDGGYPKPGEKLGPAVALQPTFTADS